nr:hypothetical protein [Tanacetum cinerariifolium]
MLCPVLVTGIGFPSPTCTDGNKRVLKSVLKLFELEFKWEEAAVYMFHVGSYKVIVLNALGAGHDGLVGKIGPDEGLVHKQWVEMGLFGAVAWRSPGKGIGVVRVSGTKKEWGLSPKAKVRVLHTAQLDVTTRINGDCQKFDAIYKHLESKSEENEAGHIEAAKVTFATQRPKRRKFQLEHAWRILKGHSKWDAPKPLDTEDHTEIFGPDARPLPAGKTRPAKKTKSETMESIGGSSSGSISILYLMI